MGRSKSTGITVGGSSGDESVSPHYEKFDRAKILKTIGVSSTYKDFDGLVSAAQKISAELFLNQAAVCLKLQQDYMDRSRPLLPIEEFRILNILSDLMRELTAYDYGVDTNRAWEFLERQGYQIVSDSEEET